MQLATHSSLASYGVRRSLLNVEVAGIENVLQLFGQTLSAHQLRLAKSNFDRRVNVGPTSYG